MVTDACHLTLDTLVNNTGASHWNQGYHDTAADSSGSYQCFLRSQRNHMHTHTQTHIRALSQLNMHTYTEHLSPERGRWIKKWEIIIKCSVTQTLRAFFALHWFLRNAHVYSLRMELWQTFQPRCNISQYLKGTTSFVCNWYTNKGTQRAK